MIKHKLHVLNKKNSWKKAVENEKPKTHPFIKELSFWQELKKELKI